MVQNKIGVIKKHEYGLSLDEIVGTNSNNFRNPLILREYTPKNKSYLSTTVLYCPGYCYGVD